MEEGRSSGLMMYSSSKEDDLERYRVRVDKPVPFSGKDN